MTSKSYHATGSCAKAEVTLVLWLVWLGRRAIGVRLRICDGSTLGFTLLLFFLTLRGGLGWRDVGIGLDWIGLDWVRLGSDSDWIGLG